jgi:hypothetical protein
MRIEIGHVEALFRYPVKSMRGERLEVARLGWHGLVSVSAVPACTHFRPRRHHLSAGRGLTGQNTDSGW